MFRTKTTPEGKGGGRSSTHGGQFWLLWVLFVLGHDAFGGAFADGPLDGVL
jgi:hypothetical protein